MSLDWTSSHIACPKILRLPILGTQFLNPGYLFLTKYFFTEFFPIFIKYCPMALFPTKYLFTDFFQYLRSIVLWPYLQLNISFTEFFQYSWSIVLWPYLQLNIFFTEFFQFAKSIVLWPYLQLNIFFYNFFPIFMKYCPMAWFPTKYLFTEFFQYLRSIGLSARAVCHSTHRVVCQRWRSRHEVCLFLPAMNHWWNSSSSTAHHRKQRTAQTDEHVTYHKNRQPLLRNNTNEYLRSKKTSRYFLTWAVYLYLDI